MHNEFQIAPAELGFRVAPMNTQEALALLDLSPSFTEAELKKAYRQALMVWHPDRFHDHELHEKAGAKTQSITQAFAMLQRTGTDNPEPAESSARPPKRRMGKDDIHTVLARFWRDGGYHVISSSEIDKIDLSPAHFAAQAAALLKHGGLIALRAGHAVHIRLVMDGDELSDYKIVDRFPEIHKAVMQLRRYAASKSGGNSKRHPLIRDWWIPFGSHDTIAVIYVVFSSSKRAKFFSKHFADEGRHTSRLYHVFTRLAVVDLETGGCSQDIARPDSGEREELSILKQALFGN